MLTKNITDIIPYDNESVPASLSSISINSSVIYVGRYVASSNIGEGLIFWTCVGLGVNGFDIGGDCAGGFGIGCTAEVGGRSGGRNGVGTGGGVGGRVGGELGFGVDLLVSTV